MSYIGKYKKTSRAENGHQGAPKWLTGSGKVSTLTFMGILSNLEYPTLVPKLSFDLPSMRKKNNLTPLLFLFIRWNISRNSNGHIPFLRFKTPQIHGYESGHSKRHYFLFFFFLFSLSLSWTHHHPTPPPPPQIFLSSYWHDFDQTLKVSFWEHLEQIPAVMVTFVQPTFLHSWDLL